MKSTQTRFHESAVGVRGRVLIRPPLADRADRGVYAASTRDGHRSIETLHPFLQ